jgi:alpha/beta superfamily hydrolase
VLQSAANDMVTAVKWLQDKLTAAAPNSKRAKPLKLILVGFSFGGPVSSLFF